LLGLVVSNITLTIPDKVLPIYTIIGEFTVFKSKSPFGLGCSAIIWSRILTVSVKEFPSFYYKKEI